MAKGQYETTLTLIFQGDNDYDAVGQAEQVAGLINTLANRATLETAAIEVTYDEGTHGTPSFTPD